MTLNLAQVINTKICHIYKKQMRKVPDLSDIFAW